MSHYDFARDYLAREWAANRRDFCVHPGPWLETPEGFSWCMACEREVDGL